MFVSANNIEILEDTLDIFKRDKYIKAGKTINTRLSKRQQKECYVFLPENINDIVNRTDFEHFYRDENNAGIEYAEK